MATAIFMVLMTCGYWYASRDLSTRFKIRRSFGWDVYFLVALYGCVFLLQGCVLTGLLWLLMLLVSTALNLAPFIDGNHYHYQLAFMNDSFLGVQLPVLAMLAFTVILCLYRSNFAHSARLSSSDRYQLYKTLTQANGVEGLMLQCMEEGELAWVSMKSRRIYVGMIHTANLDSGATSNIVLIPMLSGYRDKHTLNLNVEQNYSAWYAEHNIQLTADSDSALSFRKVILFEQIESLSLFDPASELAMPMRGNGQPIEPA